LDSKLHLNSSPLSQSISIAADFAFETGGFMETTLHGESKKIAGTISETGAFGPLNVPWEKTKSGKWNIQEQRVAADVIAAGITFHDRDLVDRGLKTLEWGFDRQQDDGSFGSPDCPQKYHSSSFFIEAAAHSLLLLEQSPFRDAVKSRTNAVKTKLLLAARWMIRPDVHAKAWDGSTAEKPQKFFGHRRFLVAAALGESGVLCRDDELISQSQNFIRDGIQIQRPDGIIPEKHGHDSHYQAQALLLAARYFTIAADVSLRAELKPMIDKGVAWLVTRIKSDGMVDATGNIRTGMGQEKTLAGIPKEINYTLIYRALYYWGTLVENAELKNLAQKVYEADLKRKTTPQVPKANFWARIFGRST
jgi:hypothetical protein